MGFDRRTYADRRNYLKAAVTQRRRIIKNRAVAEPGGACIICRYDKHPVVLDFHHLDPATKSFGISNKGMSMSWQSIRTELDKCVLVCANCHREIENGITQIPAAYLH